MTIPPAPTERRKEEESGGVRPSDGGDEEVPSPHGIACMSVSTSPRLPSPPREHLANLPSTATSAEEEAGGAVKKGPRLGEGPRRLQKRKKRAASPSAASPV
ncbi:hypothetical protein QLX08_004387 [Tetragonisca angustula]|uniref:Uncharacterized protein n=1 Tax=Tetragonisca angustula TaxID=166442 RepID=A0AAW1A4Z4_9HYME